MLAAICPQAGSPLVVEDVTLPKLGHHDVLVRTEASGVCHSDLSVARGLTGAPMPRVLGHEGVGTVLETGPGVSRCRPGDRVVLAWWPVCGSCWHCTRSETQHCERYSQTIDAQYVLHNGAKIPVMAGLGAFAEMMQVSERSVVPVETSLPSEQLALIGCCITTGVGSALWTAEVKPGSTVAIFGCGGVGLSALQGARIAGAERIFAVDLSPDKRQLARAFGATDTVAPEAGDVVEQLLAATAGRGVDYAIEVTGVPAVLLQAFDAVRRRGTVVVVGMPALDAVAPIPITSLMLKEKRLLGSLYGSAQVRTHFPMLAKMAERGMLDLTSMISRRFELRQVNKALDALGSGDVIRSVILPS